MWSHYCHWSTISIFLYAGLREWATKNIMLISSGHPYTSPCANLLNSLLVEFVHSLLLLSFSSATNTHIFPVAGSMTEPENSDTSTVIPNGLSYEYSMAAIIYAYLSIYCSCWEE